MSATREASPSRVWRRADRSVGVPAVVAVVAVVYLAFTGVRLALFDGDPSGFVTAGDQTTDVRAAPESLLVTRGTDGYDGQAYYRLAREPLTDQVDRDGIAFARPAYWQTRIGYPLAAWAISAGGRAGWVPGAMLLVNLLAVLALVLLAARLALASGRSAWWGAVPALWAGYLVGVGQDLTEPLAGALMLGALCAMRARRFGVATLALTAAGLTRETTLVLAVAVLLAASPRRTGPPWWVGAVPLAGYAGWRTWVRARWSDQVPDPPSDNPLEPPLSALVGHLVHALSHLGSQWPNLALLLPTLAALVVAATALRGRDGPAHERLALAGYLVVLLCLPVWDRGQAYLRWGCEPMLIGWLLFATGRHRVSGAGDTMPLARRDDRALTLLATLSVVIWLVAATQSIAYPRPDAGWGGGWGRVWTWS